MLKSLRKFIFGVGACMFLCVLGFSVLENPMIVEASGLEDDITTGSSSNSSNGLSLSESEISQDDKDVANWIKNQRGMTSEQLEKAGTTLSPFTNMCGYAVGGIVSFVFAGVFIITALDILYIAIPPIRFLLYKGGSQQGGQMGGGYNSGYNGYNGYNSGYNNYNSGGMQGGGFSMQSIQFISDEAVQCSAFFGGGNTQPQMQGGMQGGMQNQQAPQGEMGLRSAIYMYFKKRIIFMILLAICVIVLTSSALLGTGVNLAQWLLKIITMINGNIPI